MTGAPNLAGLELSVDGASGELVLANPQKLNPLGADTLEAIVAAARWFDTHDQLKVVVVRGAGRVFSAGADLAVFVAGSLEGTDARHAADLGRRMAGAVESMRAVTIAAIHGHCVGGGLVLAAACDLRVAATDTVFAIPEVDLGIPLAWGGIPRLVREIGPALTKELVMTCRPFDAAEAMRSGFLNRVVPRDQLDEEVAGLAETLAGKPRQALLATKQHTNAVTAAMVGTGHSWADADGLLAALADAEGRAAAGSYLRKRGLLDDA